MDTILSYLPIPFPAISMQSGHLASDSSSDSDGSSIPVGSSSIPPRDLPSDDFKLTPQDITILKEYLAEIKDADTQSKKRIIEKVMGEMYVLHPKNSAFEKKEAKEVSKH